MKEITTKEKRSVDVSLALEECTNNVIKGKVTLKDIADWDDYYSLKRGYSVQISKTKDFSKFVTVSTSMNYDSSKKEMYSNICWFGEAKTKYYVRIRTYKTVDGKKYYSNWSAKKYVTTK